MHRGHMDYSLFLQYYLILEKDSRWDWISECLVFSHCVCAVHSMPCHFGGSQATLILWPFIMPWNWSTCSSSAALWNPRISLMPMDSMPVSCVSIGLQNFVISTCWRTAEIGLNLCPFNKRRSMSFSSEQLLTLVLWIQWKQAMQMF